MMDAEVERGGDQPGEIQRGRRSVKENIKHRADEDGKEIKICICCIRT